MSLTVDNCDNEPIHIPGAIQPHGALLAVDDALRVRVASDNIANLLQVDSARVFELALSDLLDPSAVDVLRTNLGTRSWKRFNPIPSAVGEHKFDAIVHRSGNFLVVELEPTTPDAQGDFRPYGADTHLAMMRLQGAESLGELLDEAVAVVRDVTGYDRVMVYRFDEDGHGSVVAEERLPKLEPFLGLHYPASDIPAQARRLYTLNPLRIIADVEYRRAELIHAPDLDVSGPLDLTFSTLRSVSPIHVEYLRNMGVAASMSVSIVHDGGLWGLIACHHYSPRFVPYATRMTCELVGQMLSTLTRSWSLRDEAGRRDSIGSRKVRLRDRLTRADYVAGGLAEDPADLLDLVGANGAAILEDDRFTRVGESPPEDQVRAFTSWLAAEGHEVFSTHALTAEHPRAPSLGPDVAGVLALGLPPTESNALLWFRPAAERTVTWAGNPEKVYAEGPNGPRLSPRGSFTLWKQTVKDRSERWSQHGLDAAKDLRSGLLELVLRKSQDAERSRDMLLGMVSHDLRNPLGAITMAAHLLGAGQGGADEPSNVTRVSARIAASSDRMRRMIEQLLDYTRVKSGSLTVVATEFDLVELCIHLAEETTSAHPGFRVELDLPPACPFVGDVDRLAQLISNLLGNARHHGDPKTPTTLALRETPGAVEIEVRNGGETIAPERLATIFEPFKRERRTPSARKHSGLGLGLFIVRRLVELHRGTVDLTSTDERGTVCRVWLPRIEWPR